MVQLTSEPRFPVVDPDPSIGKVFSCFRTADWRNLVVATVITLPFGYAAGRPIVMRQTMYMSATISAIFGTCLGWQSSLARLTGFKENAEEREKYGVIQSTSTDTNPASA